MDVEALQRLRIAELEEENARLKQVMIVKTVEQEICKCGTPHKLIVLGFLDEHLDD